MDARTTVAQVTGSLLNSGMPKVLKLTKPQTDQTISIHLDGATKLDLTAIADDKVTFVHVGDRLVILFDNHSTVTLEPFYDSHGQPASDIVVELGPDHDVSGVEFARLFPITTDPSIRPAAGAGGGPTAGAHFGDPTVDALSTFTALDLLGALQGSGPNFATHTDVPPPTQPLSRRRRPTPSPRSKPACIRPMSRSRERRSLPATC